jgi:LmbE family N-acetylglucosaminyl deacetylase
MRLKVLCVTAHPADMFDVAGGTLIQHAEAGDEVHLLSVSPGVYSHSRSLLGPVKASVSYEEAMQIKLDELKRAAELIEAKSWRCLPYKDEPLEITRQVIIDIAQVIREVRPDILLTHHQGEMLHHDHGPVGLAALRAVTSAARWCEGLEQPRHLVPGIYFFGFEFRTPSAIMGWQPIPPTHVVDITSTIDRKMEALLCFETQNYDADYAIWRKEKVDGGAAFAFGLEYAEWFIGFTPTVCKTLDVKINASLSKLLQRNVVKDR